MRPAFLLAVLAAGTALPCLAADSPWNGTWKLNEAKSQMTGTTAAFTKSGKMYTVSTGAISYKFACDGKDYAAFADRSLTCTESGNKFTIVHMVAGKLTSTDDIEISPDGNTLHETTTGTRPDGTAYTRTETSERVGAGKGLVGTWKETTVQASVPTSILLRMDGDTLHYEDVGFNDVSDTKLDGTPGPITGGRAPAGMTVSTTADGPGKIHSTVALGGKELSKDEMTLSEDGNSITDVAWTPGKESEKRTYVYEKQ